MSVRRSRTICWAWARELTAFVVGLAKSHSARGSAQVDLSTGVADLEARPIRQSFVAAGGQRQVRVPIRVGEVSADGTATVAILAR